MSFAFKIHTLPGRRETIRKMCEKYDPGRTVIRNDNHRKRDGTVVYTVDVYDPTPYGRELLEWLHLGKQYDKERKKNPDFPAALIGPMWNTEYQHNKITREYGLTFSLRLTSKLPRHA